MGAPTVANVDLTALTQIRDVLASATYDARSFDSQAAREAPPAEESFPNLCVPGAYPGGPDANEGIICSRLGNRQVRELEAVSTAESFYRTYSTLRCNAVDVRFVPADALGQSGS